MPEKKDTGNVVLLNQPKPDEKRPEKFLGGDQGNFKRELCGRCDHWRKSPVLGLDQGVCMLMPPTALPVQTQNGAAQMLVRPTLPASYEGCDQFENEEQDAAEGAGGTD